MVGDSLCSEDASGAGHDRRPPSIWPLMDTERLAGIRSLMMRFRSAAANPLTRERYAGYVHFPAGSCTWASFAFGHLLAQLESEEDWHLVNVGSTDGGGGHDWLESHGLAVDVTGDQFEGFAPYVGPASAPLPARYSRPAKRIELSEWDPPHEDALRTIRGLMEIQSGG